MELQTVERPAAMLHGGVRARLRVASGSELIRRQCRTWSPWLIHTSVSSRYAGEQDVSFASVVVTLQCARPYSRTGWLCNAAPECLADRAASRNRCRARECQGQRCRVALRRAVGIHAGRSAGEDDAFWCNLADTIGRDVVPHDFAVHMLLADSSSDELGVLRAEVENEHALGGEIVLLHCVTLRRNARRLASLWNRDYSRLSRS